MPLFALVFLLSLWLLSASFAIVWHFPYVGASWGWYTGRVNEVQPGGEADKAGLQVGDRLISVDGAPLAAGGSLLSRKQVGERVTLVWQQGGERRAAEVAVIAPPMGLRLWWVEPLLVAAAFWLLGTIVFTLRPRMMEARLFFLTGQVSSAALCLGLLSAFGLPTATRLFNVLLCWLAPLLIHFHTILAAQTPRRRQWVLIGACYLTGALLSLPYLALDLQSFQASPLFASWRQGVRLTIGGSIVVSLLLLVRRSLGASIMRVRQRIRILFFGTILAWLPLIAFSLVPDIVGQPRVLPYQISFLALLLIPSAYGYAIWQHNLFETDRILNRTLVYTVLTLLLIGLYFSLGALLTLLLPQTVLPTATNELLLVLVMSVVILPLRTWTQRAVDRIFYAGWYDVQAVADYFSLELSKTLTHDRLSSLLVQELPRILRARGAAILLGTGEGVLALEAVQGLSGGRWSPLPLESELVHCVAAVAGPTLHPEVRARVGAMTLTAAERALLGRDDIGVWLPLRFHGKVEAILLLGRKKADDLYTQEDLQMLRILARHAATTVRNVSLVQALQAQLHEVAQSRQALEQAHFRLLEVREEERKALARDVHDGPVQDTIAISLQLRSYGRQALSAEVREGLDLLRGETLLLLDRLRNICTDLRPPDLDMLGLASAIRTYTEKQPALAGRTELVLMNDERRLPDNVAISLFRIYQEATKNILKHAEAAHIQVTFTIDDGCCTLTIEDDGCGFVLPARLEAFARAQHFGLLGIQERAVAIGASVTVTSAPGAGTSIRVEVPLPDPEEPPQREGAPLA